MAESNEVQTSIPQPTVTPAFCQVLQGSLAGHPSVTTYQASDSEDLFSVDGEEGESETENAVPDTCTDHSFSETGSDSGGDSTEELETTSASADADGAEEIPEVNLDDMLFIDDDDLAPERDLEMLRWRPQPRRHPYFEHLHELSFRRHPPLEQWVDVDQAQLIEPPIAEQLENELLAIPGEDQNVYKEALIYMVYPVALHSLPLTILIFSYYQLLPDLSFKRLESYHHWSSWLSAALACGVIIGTVGHLVFREDFRANSRSLVKQNAQLTAVFTACLILQMVATIGYDHPPSRMLYQRSLKLQAIRSHWTWMVVESFCISYCWLSLIEIPLVLWRMAITNDVFRQVLVFELLVILLPTVYIGIPFLLVDFVCLVIPPEILIQSVWLFYSLHVIGTIWIGVIIVGVTRYPEIDVQRRQGELGRQFMEFIRCLQMMLQFHIFASYLSMAHFMAKKLIRLWIVDATRSESWTHVLYFKQINENVPANLWNYKYPYPVNDDFWVLTAFFVIQLRAWSLIYRTRRA